MFNRKKPGLLAVTLCVAGMAFVHACGPNFPMQLLDDRTGTLLGTPSNSFAYEVAHLITPHDALRMPAGTDDTNDEAGKDDSLAIQTGLSAHQMAILRQMKSAANGDAAYAQGKDLPEAQRLYAAALVDLEKAGQPCGTQPENAPAAARTARVTFMRTKAASKVAASASAAKPVCMDSCVLTKRAAARLEAVLALPASERAPCALAAAIQLAEIASDRAAVACGHGMGAASCAAANSAAHAAYAQVRTLAVQGAPDPFGLAILSFGEEALLDLRSATTGQQCDYRSFENATPCAVAIPAANLAHAVNLYAQQAARGSPDGMSSLRFIADWALGDAHRAASLIGDPVAQRLLVSYALARIGDVARGDPSRTPGIHDFGLGQWFDDDRVGTSGYVDAARHPRTTTPNLQLVALVDAIRARGMTHVSDADQLAALAYRVGRYDLAATLLKKQDSALANWVRAKLALRRGDIPAAVQAYAAASRAFPTADASVEPAGRRLIEGEQAVLTLARGQYVEALNLFYNAACQQDNEADHNELDDDSGTGINYGDDMAYVAERVLTTDELKTFVDTHVPASKAPPVPGAGDDSFLSPPVGDTLRYLLARRLVRDGRIAEALPYFPEDGDPRFRSFSYRDGNKPQHYRKWAKEYAAALYAAQHAWLKTSRAQGWFEAAVLARSKGMELMGYEQEPDFANMGGDFYGGTGRIKFGDLEHNSGPHPQADTPATRAQAALAGPFIMEDERQRYAASESKPFERYHYRSIAADYAQRAADLLPPRSQAYAAVLCRATAWNVNDNPGRAKRFYLQYVRRGAYVNFGGPFGTHCGVPDFRAARYFQWRQTWRAAVRGMRDVYSSRLNARGQLAGMMALPVIACGLGLWYWRRRRKTRATSGRDRSEHR